MQSSSQTAALEPRPLVGKLGIGFACAEYRQWLWQPACKDTVQGDS